MSSGTAGGGGGGGCAAGGEGADAGGAAATVVRLGGSGRPPRHTGRVDALVWVSDEGAALVAATEDAVTTDADAGGGGVDDGDAGGEIAVGMAATGWAPSGSGRLRA